MAAMADVEWEECLVEPHPNAELEGCLRKSYGFVPPSAHFFGECPWIARSLIGFQLSRQKLVHNDFELTEKIGLVVGQENSCRFCYGVHRVLLRMIGMPEDRIRRLEEDLLTLDFDPRERSALEFARRLSRSNPLVSTTEIEALRAAGFEDPAIREIALIVFLNVIWNRFATFPALPTQRLEQLPERLPVRLLRPLLGRALRARFRRGQTERLPPGRNRGPFAYLVAAVDGLPLALSLRELIDDAWDSSILPKRTKALVFAVVARGLGCDLSEREAVRLLAEEGFEADAVGPVLAHLASPQLDPVETVAVPFARETIWYRPAAIQRRARAVHRQLSAAQFLELSGIAGLANGLCRLGFLTEMSG